MTDIFLPKIGFSMTEGTIREWLVGNGEQVEAGAAIYALEAEKAVEEVEAPASGRLEILVAAGEQVAVGSLIARIV